MKKKYLIVIIAVLLVVLLVPIPRHLKDGGTVEYKALIYKISKVHKLSIYSKTGFDEGTIIQIMGITVYNSVIEATSEIEMNEIEKPKLTWEEITKDGVNEQMLFENVDQDILQYIATEFQKVIEEEIAEETANPGIITEEGWTRIFKKEQYKKVLDIGDSAMKPLYFILYKSENAGLYEYLCSKALYELSGYDFEWANSKEFLEGFNKKVLEGSE